MHPLPLLLSALALAWAGPRPAGAIDEGFSEVLRYMRPRPTTGVGDLSWVKYVAAGAVAVGALAALANRARRRRRPGPTRVRRLSPSQVRRTFAEQAAALGLRLGEGRLLGKIALRLAPQHPANLLKTPTGREHLIADLDKRIHRRTRELETLQAVRDRLCQMRGHQIHARESIRAEVDLPVWVTRHLQVIPTAGDEDGVLEEAAPVAGRLVDLSEGGAALRTEADFGQGDILEFWSADADTPLPPMAAAVVDLQDDGDPGGPLLHLHFIDPPTMELVELHRQLQADARGRAPEPERQPEP